MFVWSAVLTYFVRCLRVGGGLYLLASCVAYCPSIYYVENVILSQCVAVYCTETFVLCQKNERKAEKVVVLHEKYHFWL